MLLLNSVRDAILDETESIEQYQIDVLTWLLECIMREYETHDIDPQMERAYHKLTGYWFEEIEPWFVRIKEFDNELLKQLPP